MIFKSIIVFKILTVLGQHFEVCEPPIHSRKNEKREKEEEKG